MPSALCIGFDLATADGAVVLRSYQTDGPTEEWPQLVVGRNVLECEIPAGLLNDGRYLVLPRLSIHRVRWISRATPPSPSRSTVTRSPRPMP